MSYKPYLYSLANAVKFLNCTTMCKLFWTSVFNPQLQSAEIVLVPPPKHSYVVEGRANTIAAPCSVECPPKNDRNLRGLSVC